MMIVFHEHPRETVLAIFELLHTFLYSKKYHLKFVSHSKSLGKLQFHQLQLKTVRRCEYEIHGMKLMDVEQCMNTVVKLDPELSLLCHNSDKNQKEKIQCLIDNCYRQLDDLYHQEKYPNRQAISQKPVINLHKVIHQERELGLSRELKAVI